MLVRSAPTSLLLAALLFLGSSCSSNKEADAPAGTDFLGMSADLEPAEDSPWDETWRAPGLTWQGWTELHIPPIVTAAVGDAMWCQECEVEDAEAKLEALATAFRTRIENNFATDPQRLLKPVKRVGDKTIVLELAIIDIVPARTWFNARGAAPAGLSGHGSIAIEGRITDGKSGRLISVFSDREECAADLLDGASTDWCCHAPLLLERWAERLVALAHAAKEGRIGHTTHVPTQSW